MLFRMVISCTSSLTYSLCSENYIRFPSVNFRTGFFLTSVQKIQHNPLYTFKKQVPHNFQKVQGPGIPQLGTLCHEPADMAVTDGNICHSCIPLPTMAMGIANDRAGTPCTVRHTRCLQDRKTPCLGHQTIPRQVTKSQIP